MNKKELEERVSYLENIINGLPSEEEVIKHNNKYFNSKDYAFMFGYAIKSIEIAKYQSRRVKKGFKYEKFSNN